MKHWLPVIARWVLGGVFVVAGALKVYPAELFANDIARYGLLPVTWVNLAALVLPWIEIVAGGLLVAGVWKRAGAAVVAVLCALFLGALTVGLWRGLEVCGCFGATLARRVSGWSLVEDGALLVLALCLWWKSED
jgi:uncharacterized membrane protein YphA (DoxX/SURF4 family)